MLLVIDVGNTNVTMGVFDGENLKETFRLTTRTSRTSDEYGLAICDLIEHRAIAIEEVRDVIISSVVPDVMYSLINGIVKYFHTTPLIVGPGIKTGIRLATENPKQIGADRIVDAVGAYELYGGPVLVIDFGTATTYDLILEDGSFVAGVTSPGIRLSANALWQGTAKLPKFEILKPKSILAKETISSMQAGLVYGYIGQTEYIIKKVKEEAKLKEMKVVATGGLGKIIADETDMIEVYDNRLTLKGLRLIYEKNKK
ncbi:MAG: type III pantothenate kinase [Lachnospiraceae bacterium]|nr:type III pantothenate kinase [Lachnospiraceae bacterium]MDD6618784.1 type III pantothenate kinase [Clostridiales bacterium]MDY4771737.1 type III pantothenate kinase [Lachnospiraceae bacterium]